MIEWEESFDGSVRKAKEGEKIILMDFFNPQ